MGHDGAGVGRRGVGGGVWAVCGKVALMKIVEMSQHGHKCASCKSNRGESGVDFGSGKPVICSNCLIDACVTLLMRRMQYFNPTLREQITRVDGLCDCADPVMALSTDGVTWCTMCHKKV